MKKFSVLPDLTVLKHPWSMVLMLLGGILMLTAGLLYFEYRAFRHEVRELVALKNTYYATVLAVKQQLAFKEASKELVVDNGKKKDLSNPSLASNIPSDLKVTDSETDQPFLVVNRDHEYLRNEAMKFSRRDKLGKRIAHLYDVERSISAVHEGRTKTRRKKKNVPVSKAKWQRFLRPVMRPDSNLAATRMAVPMIAPVDKSQSWFSSAFGPRRKPGGGWGFHNGIDLAAVKGTPVYAAAGGVIVEAGSQPGYGNTVVIQHSNKVKTRYAHLNSIKVRTGRRVAEHDLIGTVGNTGNVRSKRGRDGSHLHFEVIVAGKRVNPLYFLT